MCANVISINKYNKLKSKYDYYINSYNALYQLKVEKEGKLKKIYKMIKANLIKSKKCTPHKIIKDILCSIPFNNRYAKPYLKLAKHISDDYQVTDVADIEDISNYLFYKEYGIKLDKSTDFEKIKLENTNISSENTIYRAIMYNDKEKFITFTGIDGFDKDQKLKSDLYPYSHEGYSLLELCCYHGAVDCFKFLRTKFNSEITQKCLELSFLGGNKEIMSECFKYQKPNEKCMEYAIISHNIDFVTFLMNEYNLEIDLEHCGWYSDLNSFLVYFDQTNDINKCYSYSPMFDIPSLCKFFLSHHANINYKDKCGNTALCNAVYYNSKEVAKFLISQGANISEKDNNGETVLCKAAFYNSKEIVELLVSSGEKDTNGETALHFAAKNNSRETVEILITHGAAINDKNEEGETPLHVAAKNSSKETAVFLITHGAAINDKNEEGETPLHIAASLNYHRTSKLLISHGAHINEKDNAGNTPLHCAAIFNCKDTAKILASYDADLNNKNKDGYTALHIATKKNRKDFIEILISCGANINEKDDFGATALHTAAIWNYKEIVEFLILNGANIHEKTNDGLTALFYALSSKNKEIVDLLISHGANFD